MSAMIEMRVLVLDDCTTCKEMGLRNGTELLAYSSGYVETVTRWDLRRCVRLTLAKKEAD